MPTLVFHITVLVVLWVNTILIILPFTKGIQLPLQLLLYMILIAYKEFKLPVLVSVNHYQLKAATQSVPCLWVSFYCALNFYFIS